MKEIVIRRSIYDETKEHKLVETEVDGEWLFVPAEDWMPVYMNYDCKQRGTNIISIDSDGFGTPLYVGDTVKDLSIEKKQPNKTVKKIFFKHNVGFIIVLEDASKG